MNEQPDSLKCVDLAFVHPSLPCAGCFLSPSLMETRPARHHSSSRMIMRSSNDHSLDSRRSELSGMEGRIGRLLAGVIPWTAESSRGAVGVVLQMLLQSAQALNGIGPRPDTHVAWQELQNKLQVFSLFEQLDSKVNLGLEESNSLLDLVERASTLDRYRAVWVTEGLGHCHSDLQLSSGAIPVGMLTNNSVSPLPASSLIPLHAGMGLSLAEQLLPLMEKNVGSSLNTFEDRCRRNCRKGYFGAAYEALGFAARNLYPHLVRPIDRALAHHNPKLQAFFWHGVGRAIYFSPTNFLPWRAAPWQGLRASLREPPHILGQRNAVSGFCWALTLVNIEHPAVMGMFLEHHMLHISSDNACGNGIRSALIVWRNVASAYHLKALYLYKPDASIKSIWNELVLRSCDLAIEYHDVLRSGGVLGELFRSQPLAGLVARARSGSAVVE
jgi:hypothetical protein